MYANIKEEEKEKVIQEGLYEYQKIPSLYVKTKNDDGKITKKIVNPFVDYLKNNEWIVCEKIDGVVCQVTWDGKKISFGGERIDTILPDNVKKLLTSTFDGAEKIFMEHFAIYKVALFLVCFGGAINNGAYEGTERLLGIDVMLEGVYADRFDLKTVFDWFKIETITFDIVKNLKEIVDIVKYNQLPSQHSINRKTKISGYICTPKYTLFNRYGRIAVKIEKDNL